MKYLETFLPKPPPPLTSSRPRFLWVLLPKAYFQDIFKDFFTFKEGGGNIFRGLCPRTPADVVEILPPREKYLFSFLIGKKCFIFIYEYKLGAGGEFGEFNVGIFPPASYPSSCASLECTHV